MSGQQQQPTESTDPSSPGKPAAAVPEPVLAAIGPAKKQAKRTLSNCKTPPIEAKESTASENKRPVGKAKSEKIAGRTERPEWNGLGMCEFLRYAGSLGWDKKLIGKIAEVIG